MFQPTIYYMSDIEAAGGALILEKILKKKYSYSLWRAGLYMSGKMYKVEVLIFKKGSGRVVTIYNDHKNAPWEELEKSMSDAVNKNIGNIRTIIKRRRNYRIIGYAEIITSLALAFRYLTNIIHGNFHPVMLISFATALITGIITTKVTARALRQ